jgi:hypothetical protein
MEREAETSLKARRGYAPLRVRFGLRRRMLDFSPASPIMVRTRP